MQEAQIINGPFSAEYGGFSGLGVVHIRLRETFPDQWTARMQGGSLNTQRGFLSFSPDLRNTDSFLSYEGSHSDGPFVKPMGYRRDNVTGNLTRRLSPSQSFALKFNASRTGYDSSGQIPFSEVDAGRLSRFNDETNGDAIQQHDSRLQQGANGQYQCPHSVAGAPAMLTAGGNFHANQINAGLYPRIGREPLGVTTRAHANIANGAGYLQDSASFLAGKLILGGGLRDDAFRYGVRDRIDPANDEVRNSGHWQPKFSAAYTPSQRVPLTLHANCGRGISSIGARSIIQSPETRFSRPRTSSRWVLRTGFSRFGISTDAFLIDRSTELVYVADDGTLEFLGPSRAYGFESKLSVESPAG